jgi:hypothetical protein
MLLDVAVHQAIEGRERPKWCPSHPSIFWSDLDQSWKEEIENKTDSSLSSSSFKLKEHIATHFRLKTHQTSLSFSVFLVWSFLVAYSALVFQDTHFEESENLLLLPEHHSRKFSSPFWSLQRSRCLNSCSDKEDQEERISSLFKTQQVLKSLFSSLSLSLSLSLSRTK